MNESVSGMDASTWTMWYYSTSTISPGNGASIDYLVYNVGNSSAAGVSSDCFSDTPEPAAANKTGSIVGGVIGALTALAILIAIILFLRKRNRDREELVAWESGGLVGSASHITDAAAHMMQERSRIEPPDLGGTRAVEPVHQMIAPQLYYLQTSKDLP